MWDNYNNKGPRVSDIPLNQYDTKIQPGQDQQLLQMLCDTLEIGVSVLDKDLKYRFISDLVYKQLDICPEALMVGDPLSKCHDLMLANGMMTPEIMEVNKLSSKEQIVRTQNNIDIETSILHLGDGSSHRFTRKTLDNDYTVSMATNVTDLVEKESLLHQALELGGAGYWTFDALSKTYELSSTLKMMLSEKQTAKVKKNGIFSMVHPEDLPLAKKALKTAKNNNDKFEYTARVMIRSGKYLWC